MSIPLFTPEQVHYSTINNSTSKQWFGFGKEERFPKIKARTDCIYNIPTTKMNRTAGFGYGTRSDFTKKPGRRGITAEFYKVLRDYDDYPNHIRGLSFKFGPGRNEIKINGQIYKNNVPGPGNYPQAKRFIFGNGGPSISLKGKLHYDYNIKRNKGMPGPGTYNPVTEINKNGKYANSKIGNMKVYSFGTNNRFQFYDNKVPGPCYNLPSSFGYQYNSKYHNDRNTVLTGRIHYYKSKDDFPGPGSYIPFSEFGVMISKYAAASRKKKNKMKSKEKNQDLDEQKEENQYAEPTKENTEENVRDNNNNEMIIDDDNNNIEKVEENNSENHNSIHFDKNIEDKNNNDKQNNKEVNNEDINNEEQIKEEVNNEEQNKEEVNNEEQNKEEEDIQEQNNEEVNNQEQNKEEDNNQEQNKEEDNNEEQNNEEVNNEEQNKEEDNQEQNKEEDNNEEQNKEEDNEEQNKEEDNEQNKEEEDNQEQNKEEDNNQEQNKEEDNEQNKEEEDNQEQNNEEVNNQEQNNEEVNNESDSIIKESLAAQ